MATTKSWIDAARPRTLPLAVSGILMGCGLAWYNGLINAWVSILAIVTASLIQIFSNFANDYGDSRKGTDNKHRVGPTRTVQSGAISIKEMEAGMFFIGTLSFLSGCILVYIATWNSSALTFFFFIALGILSLLAAYFYTAGKKSYGYIGLGDLFVFIFFGLLPVAGVYYLNTGFLSAPVFFPAITIGLFSTGVLNLNNMRDINNDRSSGKITIPVRLGTYPSRFYHQFLITGGWISAIIFTLLQEQSVWNWLYMITLPFYLRDLKKIILIKNDKDLDPYLKRLSLSTLAFTLLFVTGFILGNI